MNGIVVVDASLAVKWLVNEVHSDKAYALARSWVDAGTRPVSPYLLPIEVANALHRRALRQELSMQSAAHLLEALMGSGLELREVPGLHVRALELANELHQNAVYDAHYLALAETLGCECWTADQKFHRAASPTFNYVRWVADPGTADQRS